MYNERSAWLYRTNTTVSSRLGYAIPARDDQVGRLIKFYTNPGVVNYLNHIEYG